MRNYGDEPAIVCYLGVDGWHEYMHYLYLPVIINGLYNPTLPKRLEFLRTMLDRALRDAADIGFYRRYVYVTVRRGFATPDTPLNRPGWHCDGFGTDDLNYIWSSRWPTRFAIQDFADVSTDHTISMQQFELEVDDDCIQTYDPHEGEFHIAPPLLRLSPFVVHSTPLIPHPGGERSFVKISFSDDKYNLRGNSHNHLLNYEWTMHDRAELRNDPAFAGRDSGPQLDGDGAFTVDDRIVRRPAALGTIEGPA